MKTNWIILTCLCVCFFSGCTTAKYLPQTTGIDANAHGSYIRVLLAANRNIGRKADISVNGELIAIDSTQLFVLTYVNSVKETVPIPIKEIKTFRLTYAQSKKYGWSIPVLTLIAPFINGVYSLFTFPVALIGSITATSSGVSDFQYKNDQISYRELNMFARFPQGIPAGIALSQIE